MQMTTIQDYIYIFNPEITFKSKKKNDKTKSLVHMYYLYQSMLADEWHWLMSEFGICDPWR